MISQVNSVLEESGYAVLPKLLAGYEALYFEDSSLVGFAVVFPTVSELLSDNRGLSEAFLRANAPRLRQDAIKAWNVYALFLTRGDASAEEQAQLRGLEEDLVGVRRIARASLKTPEQLRFAMSPILPLRHLGTLDNEVVDRLPSKLSPREQQYFSLFRQRNRATHELVEWLIQN